MLYLIRHATAGVRDRTNVDDLLRPLDEYGQRQAAAIADRLGEEPIGLLLTSAATRCQQTLGPLAQRLALPIETHPALFEGSSTARVLELVHGIEGDAVLCSHGDVIPDVIRALEIGGTRITGRGCAKGSIWEIANAGDRIEAATYVDLDASAPAA